MNIVFFTRRFYPQIGGVEKHVLEISKKLIKKGHTVTVISELIGETDRTVREIEGIRGLRINAGADNWFKKFRIWNEIWNLRPYIQKADIIHCHDVYFWYLPFRFIFPSKKVYITFHGYETKYPPRKSAIIIRKVSEMLSKGNICIGEYIKKWYYTRPDYVLYGGVDQIKNSPPKADQPLAEKLKIVFIGRFEKDLGLITYLNALDKLKKKKIQFAFQAYGEGSLVKKIERYGKVNKFTERVNEAVSAADIVFCSSYLLMLEGLSSKKNIIAIYENPLKEDYLRNSPFSSFVYICKNSDEVCDVVKLIQETPWKSEAMLEKGYVWARQQTWVRVAEIYLKLWKK